MALPAWVSSVLSTLFKGFLEFIQDWYASEKAEADEWAAKTHEKRLESFGDAQATTLKIERAKPKEKAATVADWDAGVGRPVMALALCLLLLLTGCTLFTKYVYVESAWPMVSLPERPKLGDLEPDEQQKVLMGYAQDLEARIGAYNQEAKKHNDAQDYPDVKPEANDAD